MAKGDKQKNQVEPRSALPQLGDLEFQVLRYITDQAPVTLRQVIDGYGAPHGLARTTVLTVMDRLRRKGCLERRKDGAGVKEGEASEGSGVYIYEPSIDKASLMSDAVRNFVDKTLGGSLTPIVAYLVDSKRLDKDDAKKLRKLVKE